MVSFLTLDLYRYRFFSHSENNSFGAKECDFVYQTEKKYIIKSSSLLAWSKDSQKTHKKQKKIIPRLHKIVNKISKLYNLQYAR